MGYYINFTRSTTDDQLNLLMAFKNKQTKLSYFNNCYTYYKTLKNNLNIVRFFLGGFYLKRNIYICLSMYQD